MNKRTKRESYIGKNIDSVKVLRYHCEKRGGRSRTYFDCLCSCGNEFNVRADAIINKCTTNCGCKTSDLLSAHIRLPDEQAVKNKILSWYKSNAKRRSLDFSLEYDVFLTLILKSCYWCGIEPQPNKIINGNDSRRDRLFSYNGIDRVNSDIGYIESNCVPCCRRCNTAKNDMTVEEWLDLCNRVVQNTKNR